MPNPSSFVTASPYRRVVVQSVDTGNSVGGGANALVTDLRTGTEFTVPLSAPHRVRPQVGDLWLTSRELGYWTFHSCLKAAKVLRASSMADAVRHLHDLGLFLYVPDEVSDESFIEMPVGAYVGEVRLFHGGIPDRWIECDGAAVSRRLEWRLFRQIGTTEGVGNGTTTFNVPNHAALGTAKYAIFAG